jgi:hypothetical protein
MNWLKRFRSRRSPKAKRCSDKPVELALSLPADSTGAGWQTEDAGVQSFAFGPGGASVNVLESNGDLWQYTSSGPSLLSNGIQSIWLENNGNTLFARDQKKTIMQFPA